MRKVLIFAFLALPLAAQQVDRWSATSGDVALSGAGTTVSLQQPASNASQVVIEQIIVYCSVACSFTQTANGAGATATAGTVVPLLPAQLNRTPPVNFFTASNVGAGTAQGGIIHVPAGATVPICLSTSCGAGLDVTLGRSGGIATNYNVVVASMTGNVNVTYIVRTIAN